MSTILKKHKQGHIKVPLYECAIRYSWSRASCKIEYKYLVFCSIFNLYRRGYEVNKNFQVQYKEETVKLLYLRKEIRNDYKDLLEI